MPQIRVHRTSALTFLLMMAPLSGLLLLKWPAALAAVQGVIASGSFHVKSDLIPSASLTPWARAFARTVSYLYTVRWALLYGLLISSAFRAFFRLKIFKSAFTGAAIGVPLMLCSCCVAPVAAGAYQRTQKLGPAIALLLAAPSLNPASIALTFLLFSRTVGVARLIMALVASLVLSGLVAAIRPNAAQENLAAEPTRPAISSPTQALILFARALQETTWQTLPFIALGVLASMVVSEVAPLEKMGMLSPAICVVLISALAVPMALPTFFELPLALGLVAAHVPMGAVAAFLFAGPAINLPSLFTLAKAAGTWVAVALAGAVFAVACLGGLVLSCV